MSAISVELDNASVENALRLVEFIGANTVRAQRLAINASLTPAKKLAVQSVTKEVKLSSTEVRKKLETRKASGTFLVGKISTPARGLLLSKFSTDPEIRGGRVSLLSAPKAPPRGIRVEVTPGKRMVVTGNSANVGKPFYIFLKNSKEIGIAQRRRVAGPKGGKIDVFHGPSISQVFRNTKESVAGQATKIYEAKLLDKLNYVLRMKNPVPD